MHPNGQIPAYEWAFSDVNPPVHAWACWRVYKMAAPRGHRDRLFLERAFQKLLMTFTWWVNRKDEEGNYLFSGGFLGLDNIGVFDRSHPLPGGATLEQADGTAWMAFFCTTMLSMALELARQDPAYEDVASKFFEHFVAISDAMNNLGGTGLWNEEDGFYCDQMLAGGRRLPLRVRSMVGIVPLFAASSLHEEVIFRRLSGFAKRMRWFLRNRQDLASHISFMESPRHPTGPGEPHLLHGVPPPPRGHHLPARHPLARAAGAGAAPRAGRERIPLPLRRAVALAVPPRAPVRAAARRRGPPRGVRAGRVARRHVRRQLELAGAGLVP